MLGSGAEKRGLDARDLSFGSVARYDPVEGVSREVGGVPLRI